MAKRDGIDLSPVVISLTFLVLTVATYIAGWETPFDAGPNAYVRWRLISTVAEVAVWIGIVGVRRKRLRRTLIAALTESAGTASDVALVPVDPVAG